MLKTLKERLDREHREDGFTLIELMVVVLIIAILLAIAIPTFLGARDTANARAVQSDLHNALTAEQTYYTNNQSFTSSQTDQQTVEPNLSWLTAEATSNGGNNVFATVYDNTGAALAASTDTNAVAVVIQGWGKDNNCYTELQVNQKAGTTTPGTYYQASVGACTAPGSISGVTTTTGNASTPANIGSGNWYAQW